MSIIDISSFQVGFICLHGKVSLNDNNFKRKRLEVTLDSIGKV